MAFGKVTLRLCDTAGLRETSDAVESIGVERARRVMKDAELVLAVFDGSRDPDDEDKELLSELKESAACVIPVLNKCDAWGENSPMADAVKDAGFGNAVVISAASGEGIDALSRMVDEKFTDGEIDLRYDVNIHYRPL